MRRRQAVIIAAVVVASVGLAVGGVLLTGHTPQASHAADGPTTSSDATTTSPTTSTPATVAPTTTAGTSTAVVPTTVVAPTTSQVSTTTGSPSVATTTTATMTSTQQAGAIIAIDGVDRDTSNVSYVAVATCTASSPASINVTISGASNEPTPMGSVDWVLNGVPSAPSELTDGSAMIDFQCPASGAISDSPGSIPGDVPVKLFYSGDSFYFAGEAVVAELAVTPSS